MGVSPQQFQGSELLLQQQQHTLLHQLQDYAAQLTTAGPNALQEKTESLFHAVTQAQLRQQGHADSCVCALLRSISGRLEAFSRDLSTHVKAPSETTMGSWLQLTSSCQKYLLMDLGLSASPQDGTRSSMDSADSSCSSSTCGSSITSSSGCRLSRKIVASKPGAGYNATYARKVAM